MRLMPIWKESTAPSKEVALIDTDPSVRSESDYPVDLTPSTARRPARGPVKESIITADITITGKIVGAGHIRIAGNFEGDVHIEGDLTIDAGAKLTGSVRAASVTIGGEIDGNIESAASVEILATGILNGDLKAGTLAVASGSRMRGRVEFGWGEAASTTSSLKLTSRHVS
jgi:cytoskeletal protein CcmA (bactofilin family)